MLNHKRLQPFMIDLVLALGVLVILVALFVLSTPALPDTIHWSLITIFSLGFFVFMGFFWRGKHGDEREAVHDAFAGKIAYSVGIAFASVGIAVQSHLHSIDPWLLILLGLMVVTRTCTLIYARLYK